MFSAFTTDWVCPHIATWQVHLKHLAGKPDVRGLEIGSFEGRSANWFADHVLSGINSSLDCVDSWALGGSETEKRFDGNTARHRSKIRKHTSASFDWLIRRNSETREHYDFIYIDGDHQAQAVLGDLTLCWPLLKQGGVLICDDYLFTDCAENQRPKLAIDGFLSCRTDWRDLHSGYQRIVQKVAIDQRLARNLAPAVQRQTQLTKSPVNGKSKITETGTKARGQEALVTCVHYADYLVHTLPLLLEQVDRVVVVSSPSDTATADVVRRHERAELVQTEAFYRDGAVFNKGAAINEGLKRLSMNVWVLLMDADIALFDPVPVPPDRHAIYGARRLRVCGPAQWEQVRQNHSMPLGEIRSQESANGYFPYGFFQLYYRDTHSKAYPEDSSNASASDYVFSLQFPKRTLLPMRVHHLEMPDARTGINWQGRQTQLFRQETLATTGVLTAANSGYWPTLRWMAEACKSEGVELCVIDHGLTDAHAKWLLDKGVQVRYDQRGRSHAPQGDSHAIPQQAWLKPKLCMESPFERTVWIDADAIPLRRLGEMFERTNRGPWVAREFYLNEVQLRAAYLMAVNLLLGRLPPKYSQASRISTGVFGFQRGDAWLRRWDETCHVIQKDRVVASKASLLDQTALVCLLCQDIPDLQLPQIVDDMAYNWSANGCNSAQAQNRINYAWEASDCLESIRSDHPEAAIVHWMGLKPWRTQKHFDASVMG